MKRRAVIIEASNVPGESFLPGAVEDASNYEKYLQSLAGGEWYNFEINVVRNKKIAVVRAAIAATADADYSLIAFSGHGSHARSLNRELDETRICLDGGELAVSDLNSGSDRCLVVVDCCRKIMTTTITKAFALNMEAHQRAAERSTRAIFEETVQSSEKGCCTVYSCDLDEAAGETKNGGYFTGALLEAGKSWYAAQNGGSHSVLRIDKAFDAAAKVVTAKHAQQHPQQELGRRRFHFPWAVY